MRAGRKSKIERTSDRVLMMIDAGHWDRAGRKSKIERTSDRVLMMYGELDL
jgi:hypothetical protein